MRFWMFILLGSFPLIASAADFGLWQFDEDVAPALKVFGILTLLSLAPSAVIMLSSFTRIVVVLSMLRTALGLQQTPPNSVLMSLALFLTLFTMMPVMKILYETAYQPYESKTISLEEALKNAESPLKKFMLKQIREQDLSLVLKLAKEDAPKSIEALPLYQIIPAFLLSELQTAFQMGFMIFLPFLLVDLLVSAVLMTMGMMMVPPMSIALPAKILLFVLIDGWNIVIQALVGSFH